jgi:phosphatidylglycerophosphatase A
MSRALRVATLGGVGRLEPGPGTWGSAVVLPFAWLGGDVVLVLGLVVAALGLWAIPRVLGEEDEDPGWIVVDEAAGMLIALAGLGSDPGLLGVLVAFLAFRVLDVFKPWPVSWADRREGAVGVMLDDVLAGAIVALALVVFRSAFPGLL